MTKRELYVQASTSLAEEVTTAWVPFTLFRQWPLYWDIRTWPAIIIIGIAFGIGHWITYRDWRKCLGVGLLGIGKSWVYIVLPEGWNLVVVWIGHVIARLIGKRWKL